MGTAHILEGKTDKITSVFKRKYEENGLYLENRENFSNDNSKSRNYKERIDKFGS